MASWTPLGSAVRYTRGRLALREDAWRLPDDSERIYPILVVGVAVGVLPLVEQNRVLLVRQYRHLQRGPSWELPGGGVLPGEDPLVAAQRELREEGGYRAERIEFLTRFYPSAAYVDETALSVDHLVRSDTDPIHDPGQAWNALTVGALTEKAVISDQAPTHSASMRVRLTRSASQPSGRPSTE